MFEYELDGEVLQFTQQEVDKRAKEKGLTTEEYLAQHPEVKPVNVEKIQGVAATDAAAASQLDTELASEDISLELRPITKKDVALSEEEFTDRFNKFYKGMGFEAIQSTYEDVEQAGYQTSTIGDVLGALRGKDKEYKGDFRDFVTILSPPDEQGNRIRQTFRVDKDIGVPSFGFAEEADQVGSMQGVEGLTVYTGGKTAGEMMAFIDDNIDKSSYTTPTGKVKEIDQQTYNFALNLANNEKIIIDGKEKKFDELNADELQQHVNKIIGKIQTSNAIPGFERVSESIKQDVNLFDSQEVKRLQGLINSGDLTVEEAIKEYETSVTNYHTKLFENSPQYQKTLNSIEAAISSRFNNDISDKLRTDAENEQLPPWITEYDSDFIRQAYVTAKIKMPKTIDETQILFRGSELMNLKKELLQLKDLDPNANYNDKRKDLGIGYSLNELLQSSKDAEGKTINQKEFLASDGTVQKRIDYITKRIPKLNELIVYDLAQQDEYQQKLKNIRVPSAFGKTIDDPNLTLDEWQGMLGDQFVQMVGSVVTFGGSTFIQEGGGAAYEILEIEAAKKHANLTDMGFDTKDVEGVMPKLEGVGAEKPSSKDVEEALKLFRKLPLEDYENPITGEKLPGRQTQITDLLNSGEVSLTEAFGVGAVTAGLDFVGNFVQIRGATKLLPKNLFVQLANARFSKAYSTFTKPTIDAAGKKVASPAKTLAYTTGTEAIIEPLQEVTSAEGIAMSTGYRPRSDEYLKRLFEAGTQALLTTGPITVGGQVVTTGFNEAKIKIFKNLPQAKMRAAINAEKKLLKAEFEKGKITKSAYLDGVEELNDIDGALSTTEAADKLSIEEAQNLINKYKDLKNAEKELSESQQKVKDQTLKEGEVITDAEISVVEADKKVKDAKAEITKIFMKNSFKTVGKRIAQIVNSRNEEGDPLQNVSMQVRRTNKELREYLEKQGFTQDKNGNWSYQNELLDSKTSEMINKVFQKKQNGVFITLPNNKKLGLMVEENIDKLVDDGVQNSFNVVQHETLHAFNDELTDAQLKEIASGLMNEIKALSEKDKNFKAIETYLNQSLKKFDKDSRTYNTELLSYLSDVFHILDINSQYLNKANSLRFFGMAKYFQKSHQELFKTSKDLVSMSPSQLIDFIRKYNVGKKTVVPIRPRKSTDVQEEEQKTTKTKALASDLYNQVTLDFESNLEAFKDIVGEEKARILAANIIADMLKGEAFNRLPKNEIEGFDTKDLQDIIDDFASDPEVLARRGEEYAKIKNRGLVALIKDYDIGFEGGIMGYLNSKQVKGIKLLDLRLLEFLKAHPNYGNFRNSLSDAGVIAEIDQTQESLSPEELLIQKEEQKEDTKKRDTTGTLFLHEEASKLGLKKLTEAFDKLVVLFEKAYQEGKLTNIGIKDLKKKFPKEYQETFDIIMEAFGVKKKPGNLTESDIRNAQQVMAKLGVDFFRKNVFMNQYTKGVVKVDENGNTVFDKDGNPVIDKKTQYLSTGVPAVLQSQRDTKSNDIKEVEDLFYETITTVAKKGPKEGQLIPKRPKNLVIKKLRKFDDKFFNDTFGIKKLAKNVVEKDSNISQKYRGLFSMMSLEIMSQAARQNMPRGRDFDMLQDGLPASLASDFISGLSPELFSEFGSVYKNINKSMDVYADDYEKKYLKQILREKLSEAFSDPMITKLTNALDPVYENYSLNKTKIKETDLTFEDNPTLNQLIEDEIIQDINLANTFDLVNDDGSKAFSMDEVWTNEGHVIKMRQATVKFAEQIISKFGQEKGLEIIIKYLLPSVVGSGKIGDGRFDIVDGKLVFIGEENAGRNRKKLFKNLDDFFNSEHGLNQLLDEYLNITLKETARLDKDGNPVQQISEVFVGDTKIELNTTLLAQSSSGMINKIKKAGNETDVKKQSRLEAEEAMNYIDDIIRFFNESNYLSDTHMAMMLNGLNSDMKSPMRRAARFKYVADGINQFKNPGKELEYEHMIPAQWQMMRHVAGVKDGSLTTKNLKEFYDQYTVAIIPKKMDLVIKSIGLNSKMFKNYQIGEHSSTRYYNIDSLGRENIVAIRELGTEEKFGEYHQEMAGKFDYNFKTYKAANNAISTALASDISRGMSTFDFDETLIDKGDNFIIATKGKDVIKISSAAWPIQGPTLQAKGYKFNFDDFINVRGGVAGPLMTKFKNQIKKYGISNVFILTARPAESAPAIQAWLKTQGVNMPIENITGLGNSTGEAKAMWMLEKFAEGYNDMYFVDDALPNVKAVKNVLDQLDIKSKVRQARPLASDLNTTFNKILEEVTGIEAKKRFSRVKARKRGAKKGRFRLFIPPSHEDFTGLLYNFMGKGELGNKHRQFFEENLIRPLNRAYRELNAARQAIASDYKNLLKNSKDIRKKLKQKLADGDFTFEDAVRVYLWDKHGHEIPGLSPTDQKKLVEAVMMDQKLRMFAEVLDTISRQDEYIPPSDGWEGGSIKTDLNEAMGATGRKKYFSEYLKNAEVLFSEENLNKIEAAFGPNLREALLDILYRIENGRNRPQGQGRLLNTFLNWLNGSVASVMFLNMRSALLQQMSIVNFINFADNNIFAAAKAFANQKQYWSDWADIFNSDFLKERRSRIGTDINGADLAEALRGSRNPMAKLLKFLLNAGFTPTQIADNVAIATGGATFLRNRINTYLKQGLSKKEAESRAFEDFQEIAEETQQSAREDKVSQQQASWVGKAILNFQNVTSQYNRIGKKAFSDLKNRRISKGYTTQRQSDVANVSRIAYYFAVQNLIFYALQSAIFAAMFDEEEEGLSEKEKKERKKVLDKKSERIINGSIDSVLRGTGILGAVLATLKNMAIKYTDERNKNYNHDESAVLMEGLNVSPVVGIKARKIVIAEKTMNYDKKLINYMDLWDIDNPIWQANFAYTEAITNAPLAKTHNKIQNVRDALNLETSMLNRVLMFFGYSKYNLGVEENLEMQMLEKKAKEASKKKKEDKKVKKVEPVDGMIIDF